MKSEECKGTILVGEEDLEVQEYLRVALRCRGYSVELAQDVNEVLESLERSPSRFSAVMLDFAMPLRDGMDTLKEIRRIDSQLPVIIVSGTSSPPSIVSAMKNGATDFLSKPVDHDELQRVLDRTLETRPVENNLPPPRVTASKTRAFLGNSRKMLEIQSLIGAIGWSEAPVLIQGETGSGKEVLARELHARSPRSGRVFLKLNCAALPSELVESELFGYERGAFTGAFQKKQGMFELANGGTLLLDEIGDMDVRLQAKLLQVLQDQEFQRIGGKETIRVDVRIMAATHRDLEAAIADGTFREDLFYRLNVLNVQLPPLRERGNDILTLAENLMERYATAGKPLPSITPELRHALLSYHWPGNVRELENTVRKLLILRDQAFLARELQAKGMHSLSARPNGEPAIIRQMPRTGDHAPVAMPVLEQVTKAKRQAEASAILAALNSTRWNRKQAAASLQIDYKALLYKMKKLGLEEGPASVETEKPPRIAAARGAF